MIKALVGDIRFTSGHFHSKFNPRSIKINKLLTVVWLMLMIIIKIFDHKISTENFDQKFSPIKMVVFIQNFDRFFGIKMVIFDQIWLFSIFDLNFFFEKGVFSQKWNFQKIRNFFEKFLFNLDSVSAI